MSQKTFITAKIYNNSTYICLSSGMEFSFYEYIVWYHPQAEYSITGLHTVFCNAVLVQKTSKIG